MGRNRDLKAARAFAGLTQYDVSRAIGISEKEYSYYENGKASPQPSVALRIAKVLDTSESKLWPDMFLKGSEVQL